MPVYSDTECTLLRKKKWDSSLQNTFSAKLFSYMSNFYICNNLFFFPIKPEQIFCVIMSFSLTCTLTRLREICMAGDSRYTHGSVQLTNQIEKHLKTTPQMEKLKDL